MIDYLSSQTIATAAQMQAIENLMFQSGMPVAALMEKVALRITQRLTELYPAQTYPRVGILVGSGHNGGDALVVARELHHQGRLVKVHTPLVKSKPLTRVHGCYAKSLGIDFGDLASLQDCNLIVDGLFGFGLERNVEGTVAIVIDTVNNWQIPILSIDVPSGLHSDRGEVMGIAIRATNTFCLGLWKRGLLTEVATPYVGKLERISFDIPDKHILQIIGDRHALWRIDPQKTIRDRLPISRNAIAHKYEIGHLLLVVGSVKYGGAAILAAMGAKATGVGMLSIAVPNSLKSIVLAQVPDALVIGCAETESGAIAELPDLDLHKYQAIACGCGLSVDARLVVEQILNSDRPLVLDADGLNILAAMGKEQILEKLQNRTSSIILTPHWGEFCRLFPDLREVERIEAVQSAVSFTKSTILLKGARTAISFPERESVSQVWINPESTSALARGGSGDVLAGIIGGLLAQGIAANDAAIAATVWHSQTAIWLASQRTEMGVDPVTLAQNLLPFLQQSQVGVKYLPA
ncbi:MAG: bifunctional ADP-dependent NAD(P)H-hydrate dehydratase/NAD(P)H-hydrate epimerase [Pseudanabaena frigida]|uniref:Bifunctional NAD(P)H-hydrate repair enzyme n=1 Tax=Pseudanabaena frigida TaxID=945775 RepID=A0A2W4Y8X7_9CYAN|nr:MAG: bifunctional ADP-dependent NAD(P)H-hydrate dehydratase/NAD(P)H-hydrate epimerase [Pseudanabaena frigida]